MKQKNLDSTLANRIASDLGKYPVRRIAWKILRASLLYLGTLYAAMFLIWLWGNSRVWTGQEPNYYFLKWAENNSAFICCFLSAVGEFLIFAWYLHRMGTYFQEVTTAIERIQAEDDSWITLSKELEETASYLNRLKTQLQQSRIQAREAEQRKNDLVVYLAHDLKTPLTSVLGYLAILEESPELPREQREQYLAIARKKSERLEELINEFFEITRFNLTDVELEMRRINFTLLLRQTIFEFRPMLEGKNLSCRLDGEEDVTLLCDLDKIQRVIDNLLRNACSYAYEDTEILLTLRRDPAGSVLLTCTNQGPTIPAEKLDRIFEQFYRLDSARASSTGGAGLGLAIARQIVRLHGGSISAKSADETTTFTVELPTQ